LPADPCAQAQVAKKTGLSSPKTSSGSRLAIIGVQDAVIVREAVIATRKKATGKAKVKRKKTPVTKAVARRKTKDDQKNQDNQTKGSEEGAAAASTM
jgi:hypothetical protein